MKRIRIAMLLGYLLISSVMAFGYICVSEVPRTEIEVWSETISYAPPEVTPGITAVVKLTTVPTGELTPKENPTPTEALVLTKEPTPTIIPIPTVTTLPTPATCPEIIQEDEVGKDNRESVTYNGKVIRYRNTDYRMNEKALDKIISMVHKEPYVSAFVLYDINSEALICYNEERYFPVASTVKAPFAMTCLRQIEEGLYSLEDEMEYTSQYQVRGDGVIKNEEIGTVYTVKELLEHAILISDDIGYLMLQGYFGHKTYNQFLMNLENRVTIDGNNVKWGQTSAEDSLRNWQEIYRYINSESEYADFFAELLKNTNKSFIRNALGGEYEVLNKMGWVRNQCCHDHAIIMDEQPYLMMIMTMGDVGKENQKFMEELAMILNEVHEEMIAGN